MIRLNGYSVGFKAKSTEKRGIGQEITLKYTAIHDSTQHLKVSAVPVKARLLH